MPCDVYSIDQTFIFGASDKQKHFPWSRQLKIEPVISMLGRIKSELPCEG